MSDVLIRDVPDDVIAAIDATARRPGLSRTESGPEANRSDPRTLRPSRQVR